MDSSMIITIFGFLATIIAVMTPIIKLNTSITKLNVTIDNLNKLVSQNGIDIDAIKGKLQEHEIRIVKLEGK